MKNLIIAMTILSVSLAAIWPAQARDTKHILPIVAAMATKDANEKLEGSVKFFFGKQEYPKVVTKLGSDVSNRKTNAFGKSDEKACNWAFLSAMIALERRAIKPFARGGVKIVSDFCEVGMARSKAFWRDG